MKKIFITLVLILVACNVQAEPFDMDCTIVEDGGAWGITIERCENQEVICYIYDGYREGGISCKLKDKR